MDHILMKTMELKLYVTDLPPSREKSIIITKLDEIRHWATDLKATNPEVNLMEKLDRLDPIVPPK